jgi:Ca2+-binding EF-hand superfamily protein
LLIIAVVGPCAEAQVPADVSGTAVLDAQDLVFFHANRPLHVRIRIHIDGQAFQTAWQNYLRKLFSFLDANGDGVLNPAELAHAPSAEQLVQMLRGSTNIEPGPAPAFREVDITPADGKVSFDEFMTHYLRQGVGPVQLEIGTRPNLNDPLSSELFRRLDVNNDRKLSPEELKNARVTLHPLDLDDDEMISPREMGPNLAETPIAYRVETGPETGFSAFPFMLVRTAQSTPLLVSRLLARYDKDKNQRLSLSEIALDKAVFDRLDANHDGELDASELAGWLSQPPDLELGVHFGKEASAEGMTIVRAADPRQEALSRSRDGAVNWLLPETQLVIRRRESTPGARGSGRDAMLAKFKSFDANNDGFVENKEVYRPPFDFVAYLRLADRDGDGKVSRKEFEAWLDLQQHALTDTMLLTVVDRGRTLFGFLDADHDGRLGPRELNSAWNRLEPWLSKEAGGLRAQDVPHQFEIIVSQGQLRFGDTADDTFAAMNRAGPRLVRTAGPLWFRKMDRNHDGDVSRREFLGTDEDFKRIDTDGDGLIDAQEAEKADAWLRGKTKQK